MNMNTPRVNRDTTEAAAQSIAVTERIQIHPTSKLSQEWKHHPLFMIS